MSRVTEPALTGARGAGLAAGEPACWPPRSILRQPLPGMAGDPLTRLLLRGTLGAFRRRILSVEGAERIAPERGPLIVVANHNQRTEAVLFPALLAFLRNGHRVRFMADWNFALIPPVGMLYWAGRVIVLTRKPAKPACLNVFRPLFGSKDSGFERARRALAAGESVGIFPEGTTNRNRERLLKGYSGAAWLSLVTGAPLLPAGLVYPSVPPGGRVHELAPMAVRFGEPLPPGAAEAEPAHGRIREWHGRMMKEISRLCGKSWQADAKRKER